MCPSCRHAKYPSRRWVAGLRAAGPRAAGGWPALPVLRTRALPGLPAPADRADRPAGSSAGSRPPGRGTRRPSRSWYPRRKDVWAKLRLMTSSRSARDHHAPRSSACVGCASTDPARTNALVARARVDRAAPVLAGATAGAVGAPGRRAGPGAGRGKPARVRLSNLPACWFLAASQRAGGLGLRVNTRL